MRPRRAQEDHTSPAFTETVDGLVPAFGSTNGYYLRDDGVWAPAPGAFDWIPDVERRDSFVTGGAYERGMGAFVGGSGGSGVVASNPSLTGISRVPHTKINHTVVGLGTRWTGWSAARPGPLSTHRGFWAQWLFGGGAGFDAGDRFATGLKDASTAGVTDTCLMVGVSRWVGATYICWSAAPALTTYTVGAANESTADDIDDTATAWTFDETDVYRLTLYTDPGEGDVYGVLYRFSDGAELTHTFPASVVPEGYKLGPWMVADAASSESFCMANVRTRAGIADGLA